MAKITGPLLSLKASGTVGKTQTYASWRGVNYVRSRVIPANPQTMAQQATRNTFIYLSALWKQLPADAQAPWTLYAKGQPFTDRNALAMFNLGPMRAAASTDALIGSPGANAGLPLLSLSSTSPGAGALRVAFTESSAPPGWTFTDCAVLVILDQDPTAPVSDYSSELTTASTSPINFSGLTSAATYDFAGWSIWTKPDGSTAYGPSLNGTQVIT